MNDGRGLTGRALGPFLALSFGLTWGIFALLVLFGPQLEAVFGKLSGTNPLFILAVYSPAFAAVLLVWRHHGGEGLRNFFRRLTLWRMPAGWWVFLLLSLPAVFYAGAAIKGTISDPFPFSPWYRLLPALVTVLLIGPVEEFGWRGVALPILQRRMAPFWAGLVLGLIWAVWHIPAFLLSGTPQAGWSFPAFFIAAVSMSVIMTPMFNASRGSLLVAGLMHFQANGPAWPDAQPWDAPIILLVAVAVVWLNRGTLFRRDGAAVDVLLR